MGRYIKIFSALFLLLCLYTCVQRFRTEAPAQSKQFTVEKRPLAVTLHYAGVLEPLQTKVVTSPVEGVVADVLFHYGEAVKQGQLLFSLISEKFQTDYKAAFMQYVKAKTEFVNSQSQLRAAEFLYRNQLISTDDFKAKKNNYYTAQLSLLQAKDALDLMLKQLGMPAENLYHLNIEEVSKITDVLHAPEGAKQLQIVAPQGGIILLPIKNSNGEAETKKIMKGDAVKQSDVLAMIGNTQGLKVHIHVSEFNVNQLHAGQKVRVSGAAFPDFVLAGEVVAVDHQGQATAGGLPTFPVEIAIPKLTAAERAVIHVGMSAEVAIDLGGKAVIAVPIAAVLQKDGKTYVKIKKHTVRMVPVKTGQTTVDAVVIEEGLKVGDVIVLPN